MQVYEQFTVSDNEKIHTLSSQQATHENVVPRSIPMIDSAMVVVKRSNNDERSAMLYWCVGCELFC